MTYDQISGIANVACLLAFAAGGALLVDVERRPLLVRLFPVFSTLLAISACTITLAAIAVGESRIAVNSGFVILFWLFGLLVGSGFVQTLIERWNPRQPPSYKGRGAPLRSRNKEEILLDIHRSMRRPPPAT